MLRSIRFVVADKCQRIYMCSKSLEEIYDAIELRYLPIVEENVEQIKSTEASIEISCKW